MIESRDKQHLWISTVWGLNRFNKQTSEVRRFLYDSNNPYSLGYNMLWHLYLDNTDMLWIGTDNAGVNVLNLNDTPLSFHSIGGSGQEDNQYTATVFCEDVNKNFWIGTFDGGLWKYDHKNFIDRFLLNTGSTNKTSGTSIFSLCYDSENILWAGTSNGDLYKYHNHEFAGYRIRLEEGQKETSSVIEIMEDQSGRIWIGTIAGLYYLEKTSGVIETIATESLNSAVIRSICEDKQGALWIGTHGEGLYRLDKEDREVLGFKNFQNEPDNPGSISSNTVMSVYEDYSGNIWIATIQGLNKYNPNQDNFETYGIHNGLKAEYLYHIQGDKNSKLWITCSDGIIRFDPGTGISKLYEFGSDVSFQDIYPYSFYLSESGKIYVGGKYGSERGYYTLDQNKLNDNKHLPPVALTNFSVHNEVLISDSIISARKNLKLDYDQNFFSFEFSALDYTNPAKNQYAYMLEGLDEKWTFCGNRRFANYTDLSPGRYKFRVKGSNNDGYWNENGTSINITIFRPPWKTWWAYMIYGAFLIGLIYAWRKYDLKRQGLKQQLELEHLEAEKLKELDGMKSRFFANISHEFRTPLTLILSPLEKLKSKIIDQESAQDLNIMQRNARQLQNLINQLLGLSKLESGKMKLQVREENIIKLVNGYVQSFESLANQKNIKLLFNSTQNNIPIYIDQDKLEKILYNLLSNAFKFTGDGGRITVTVGSEQSTVSNISTEDWRLETAGSKDKYVEIRISDTGQGIPPKKLEHIFDRFYQSNDSYDKIQEGSGIGLALTKELVELHHGEIRVKSQPGKGTEFTVCLPAGSEHYKTEEIIDEPDINITDKHSEPYIEHPGQELLPDPDLDIDDRIKDSKPLILIVEDNDELRSYIRSYFIKDYHIMEAINGETGLEKAFEKIPNLVISDVMMPKMDGLEFCQRLKTDERTSHIPVILLTAKAAMEDKIEGLETGADDFLTKPFDPEELKVRIKNLIIQRNKLREQFFRELDFAGQMTSKDILSLDREFLQKAKKTVEDNLSDYDFSIEVFAQNMNLSRVQLHRKLKALIDQSAGEFLRMIRLNHAAGLIRSKSGNITQIAYEVGFNNLSYFSKCFREQFGVLPSEYTGQSSKT